MKKKAGTRTLKDIVREFPSIDFPEYQREPTVWDRRAKQRLIDSIIRAFDIASIYVYRHDDGSLDCIDGRQRLNAIMSFVGQNPEDDDNAFPFVQINDIYDDPNRPYQAIEGMTYTQISERNDALSRRFLDAFNNYELIIVELEQSARAGEFNLQFTRLNLGQIISSGEKLHAMIGAMRDACFKEGSIGLHPFLEATRIPTRRYAREQTAAQILAQIFSLESADRDFTRTRHFDLQRFFKDNARLSDDKKALLDRTRALFDLLAGAFDQNTLRNRAMTVSTVLLAWRTGAQHPRQATALAAFIVEFLARLRWQVAKLKELAVDAEYHYLIDFQRHLTQASVEKPAVKARSDVLEAEFAAWSERKALTGDQEYVRRTGEDPSELSRQVARR